jgi:hypothetical protein
MGGPGSFVPSQYNAPIQNNQPYSYQQSSQGGHMPTFGGNQNQGFMPGQENISWNRPLDQQKPSYTKYQVKNKVVDNLPVASSNPFAMKLTATEFKPSAEVIAFTPSASVSTKTSAEVGKK